MMPKYQRVFLSALGYELGPVVVTTAELEERLAPAFTRLGIQPGQLEAWTGISERRWWQPGTPLSQGATAAARKALAKAGLAASDLGMLLYCGVCRENFEPATACAVADGIGLRGGAFVYDLSNACLGVLNGMIEVANRIELGQIRAGLVVSCESAREINEIALARMLNGTGGMDEFAPALATFTGGSGAVAVLLTDGSFPNLRGHRLLGAVSEVAPEFHQLCRWGIKPNADGLHEQFMTTDSVAVLKNGVALGQQTWKAFLDTMNWNAASVDKVICHQVGSGHQDAILKSIGVPREKDYTTFRFLGNMGTAALPVTAAIADERGVLKAGQRVAFLCIGLHYLDEGAGEAVVMVHGNPTWSFYYRKLVLGLRGQCHTIVPDHIGCGLSDKPDDARYQFTLARRVADLDALIRHAKLREKITLVLHDWGGMIGMTWAAQNPHRIARLVLLNTAAFHLPKTKKLPPSLWVCRNTPLDALLIRKTGLFVRLVARWGVATRQLSPIERDAYLAPSTAKASRLAQLRFVQDIPLTPDHPTHALVTEVQGKLAQFQRTPTLLCWGAKDWVFDDHFLAEWKRLLPQAEVHRFPDASHLVLEDKPDEILTLVKQFFAKHPVKE